MELKLNAGMASVRTWILAGRRRTNSGMASARTLKLGRKKKKKFRKGFCKNFGAWKEEEEEDIQVFEFNFPCSSIDFIFVVLSFKKKFKKWN